MKQQILSALGAMFVAACGVALTGCTNNGNYTYAHADDYSVGAASFDTSTVRSLDIDWINGDVELVYVYADVERISIAENVTRGNITDDFTMRYLVENGTLKVKYAKSGRWNFGMLIKTLTVTLPYDIEFGEVEVDTASANVVADKLVCSKADIDTASGSIKLKNVSVTDFDADTASGNVDVELSAKNVDINTASGNVSVILSNAANSIDVDTASGRVTVTMAAAPDKIDIDTASGSVNLYLPTDAGFKLDYSTASGDFDSDFAVTPNGKRKYTCGDGKTDICVDTASGDLNIYKK